MKKCIIIIPIYKTDLYDYEIISLKQVLSFYQNKYNDIDICFVYSWDLNLNELEKYNITLDNIITFSASPTWFQSIETYNKLCFVNQFYSNWINNYEYMLIHQLDAFILKDELHYWCNKGYDYIGAYVNTGIHNCFLLNGGLSLRKISKFTEITETNDINSLIYTSCNSEDNIYTNILYPNGSYKLFVDSIIFSIDVSSHMYIPLCNMIYPNLPFGIHAFQKSQYTLNLCKENINYKE